MSEPTRVTATLGVEDKFVRLLALHADDVGSIFPNQIALIKGIANATMRRWIDYASGRELPDGSVIHRWSGAYAQSIDIEHDGELRYTIFSDDPKANIIEEGAQGWDMKKLLHSSHKARISKDGKRYMIFPFRHGTPGTTVVGQYTGNDMPIPVHQWWLARDRDTWTSVVTDTFEEASIQDGETKVLRRRYAWGDRLTARDVSDIGLDPEEEGRKLVGMVRFDNPETGRHGHYLTFRVMTEDSDGWQIPAREGKRPAQAALDFAMEEFDKAIGMALDADIRHLQSMLEE